MSHLRLDEDNIVSSAFEDVDIPQELVHGYVWKGLDRWSDKIATVCSTTGKSYTYSELRTLSGRFASSLRKCEFNPGSTIALVLPNVPEYAIIILGASEAGVKVTMCNPISTAKEIRRQLEDSEASAVITTPELYSAVKHSISRNENIKMPIIVVVDDNDSPPQGSIRFQELISDSIGLFNESSIPDRNIEDTIFLPYSSGTTGFPKGVEISHRCVHTHCPVSYAGQIPKTDRKPFEFGRNQEMSFQTVQLVQNSAEADFSIPGHFGLFSSWRFTLFIDISSQNLLGEFRTLALPGGALLERFRNVTSNCEQVQTEEISLVNATTATQQDVVPVLLPVFHIYGLVVVLINSLSLGAKLVFLRKFTPESALRCLKEYRPTVLHLVPPLVMFLGNSDLVSHDHLDNVRVVLSAAAPIAAESIRKLLTKARLGTRFVQGYGLTETCSAVAIGSKESGLEDSRTVGFLLPSTQLRIVGVTESDAGRNMGVNETGELYIKGPQVMKGYHKNPEATRNTMDGEWFKTGDLGCFDENGHILIQDRLKELIKVKGFQVAPAELEELLLSNDGILDAAVTAEAHPRYGEIPKAFVVRRPGSELDEEAVKTFVAERVPSYKQLGSVKFVDKIPKSAAGKILRKQLKDL